MSQDMGGFAVVGGATGPADMGGFSPVPVKPSADLGGFTIVGGARQQPAAKPAATYPSKQDFSSIADKAFGPGKWTPTSEFRTKAHNAQVGGVAHSNHMKGTPDNPGAYDIVVPGMNAAQIGTALKKAGWAGTDYPEKDHLHTNAPAVKPPAEPVTRHKPDPPAYYNRPGYPQLKPAPTGWNKVKADFATDMAPAMKEIEARNKEQRTSVLPTLPVKDAEIAFDALSGAIQGTVGRALFPHDNNIAGYNEEHRKMVGDVGTMVLPVERPLKAASEAAGAVVDGFKVLTRSPEADERAAKAVRAMTGRKPAMGQPGAPYVAGIGPGGRKTMARAAGAPTDPHTEELFKAMDAEITRLTPASKNRPLHGPAGSTVGFQARDASNRSLIAWAVDRQGVPEGFTNHARTIRHEAIHALKDDGFFTTQEWAALEKQAKAENWMERYQIHDRYRGYTDTHKLEESIADRFADWRAQRDAAVRQKGLSAHVTRAFQRLDDLLGSVKGHVNRLFGKDATAESIFRDVDRGKVGRRDRSGFTADELAARRRQGKSILKGQEQQAVAPQSGPGDMGGFEPLKPASGTSSHPTDNVIGKEKDPVERVDNALYRLGNHDTASKVEAKQFLDDVPDAIKDPKVQERLTQALEERLKNPDAPIPPDLQEAYDAYKPWAERQRAAINEIRQLKQKAGMPTDYDEDVGYVPRYRVGHSPGFDEAGLHLPGDKQRSTLAGGKSSLKTKSKSEFNRQFHVVTDADGRESFVDGPVQAEDPTGRPYAKVRQATIEEIETATAGDVKYHKNALVNTMVRALDDEKTLRNLKVLEELKSTLKKQGLAFQRSWHDADGVRRFNKQNAIPEGMVEVTHIPQLEGWYLRKDIAEAFQDYHPLPHEPEADVIQKINRLATASLFATPFPHIGNVGAMWITGRGWDWMNPGAYPRAMKAGARALQEVLTLGPGYRQMLREGSALRAADDATRNFHESMLKAAGHEIESNPQTFKALAKAFGVGSMTPADVVRTIYNASHRMLWTANDVMMLQRQFELEAKGMKTRDAIAEAEKWIANYRVPPQVMKSRSMSRLLTNNHAIVFGRYEYGKWRALGEMAKPFLGKATGAERLDRLGKIMALGILTTFVYPKMDAMLSKATGNPDAQVRRGGEAAIVDALSPSEKEWPERMGSLISVSPFLQAPAEILNNRYGFTGQPIIEPQASPAGAAAEAVEGASQYVMPAASGLQALQPGGLEQSLGALAGLKLPAKDKETGYRKRDKFQRSEARRRERRDPLTQDLKDVMP